MQLSTKGKDRVLVPEGTHLAICISIIDMGTQEGANGDYRALNFGFEVPDEKDEEGNKLTAYRMFSAKLTPKSALGKAVAAWLGRKFDKDETVEIGELAGKSCQITVTHNEVDGTTYANITGITGVPKGVKVAKPSNEVQTLFLEKGEFDREVFDALPDWLQEKIKATPEYQALRPAKPAGKPTPAAKGGKPVAKKSGKGKNDDDMPF